jgi:hypothetical protein
MSIDKFFDKMDELATGVEKVLSTAHHPDKVYRDDDIEDAEVVHEEVTVILGLVGEGFEIFRGSNPTPICGRVIKSSDIEARKRLGGNGHSRVCNACLLKLITFQTQSLPK